MHCCIALSLSFPTFEMRIKAGLDLEDQVGGLNDNTWEALSIVRGSWEVYSKSHPHCSRQRVWCLSVFSKNVPHVAPQFKLWNPFLYYLKPASPKFLANGGWTMAESSLKLDQSDSPSPEPGVEMKGRGQTHQFN